MSFYKKNKYLEIYSKKIKTLSSSFEITIQTFTIDDSVFIWVSGTHEAKDFVKKYKPKLNLSYLPEWGMLRLNETRIIFSINLKYTFNNRKLQYHNVAYKIIWNIESFPEIVVWFFEF